MSNYSFHALAGGCLLAHLPAFYTAFKIRQTVGNYDNAMPRSALDRLQGKMPQDVWNTCFRATSAHRNGMENFTFFVAATLAGNIARLPASELNSFVTQYLVVRLAYTLIYINTPAEKITLSYVRSMLWAVGCGLCAWTLVKAGRNM